MITRPLDLSSRLRPAPRSFDFLFFVNAGLIALMFALFGSRFVLSPGLGVDFTVPTADAALMGAVATDVVIAVKGPDLAFVEGAKVDSAGLSRWLVERAKGHADLRLLVQADASLSTKDLTDIYEMARQAGFKSVQIAAEPSAIVPSPAK
ncbi:MAG TPA: biopolymer transporter ExbD [Rariglobus sp.]|jgi:biopolymer transport protein ExbD|nr:biopolymer transporter ExbD [Rariglobus sp.]